MADRKEFAINEKVSVLGEGLATITDKMFSEVANKNYYCIKLINGNVSKKSFYDESSIEKISVIPQREYVTKVICEDGVVVVRIYEKSGDLMKEAMFNHAHVLHEGIEGYVQAVNQATFRMLKYLNSKETRR